MGARHPVILLVATNVVFLSSWDHISDKGYNKIKLILNHARIQM